jgi:hypothetical protein
MNVVALAAVRPPIHEAVIVFLLGDAASWVTDAV